jgi:quinol monooxygenase YgiN
VILSLIELTPIPSKREDLLELLRYCATQVRTARGCLGSNVYEAGDIDRTVLYLERWGSTKEFHRHVQSNLYRAVLNGIDLAEGPREISFYEVSNTKSMDLVAALRSPVAPAEG